MLKVRVPIREMRPGDVFELEGRRVTLERAWLDPKDSYGHVIVKEADGRSQELQFCWEVGEFVVVSCAATDIAARIVEELTNFDTAVIRDVLSAFCAECGERECVHHPKPMTAEEWKVFRRDFKDLCRAELQKIQREVAEKFEETHR